MNKIETLNDEGYSPAVALQNVLADAHDIQDIAMVYIDKDGAVRLCYSFMPIQNLVFLLKAFDTYVSADLAERYD